MLKSLDLTSSLHPDDSVHLDLYEPVNNPAGRKEFLVISTSTPTEDLPLYLTREEARALFNWLGLALTLDGQ